MWYQKCYDPECRGYRSDIMPLPPEIMARLRLEQRHPLAESPRKAECLRETALPEQRRDSVAACAGATASSAVQTESRRGAEGSSIGVDALVASVKFPVGGAMGVFEGMPDDDACDRDLLSLLEACEAKLRSRDPGGLHVHNFK